MAEDRVFKLRVTYLKAGRLAMLSHLELARALERTVRRANLPFAVSQGFSPHMRIAFGSALPVGVGSTCEVFDLALTAYMAPQKALAALRAASPADLMPQDAVYLDPGAPAASTAFPISAYRARIDWGGEPPAAVPVPETITVARKKGDRVYRVADFLVQPPVADGEGIAFELRTLQSGSLRADVFVRSCLESLTCAQVAQGGEGAQAYNTAKPHLLSVTRTEQRAR